MKIDEIYQKDWAESFTVEQTKEMYPQARGELLGFALHLARTKATITASQLRMAIQLADEVFAKPKTRIWEAVDLPLSHKFFSDEELVSQYLELNKYWFNDETNALHNKREESRVVLLYWLANNDEPASIHYSLVYVINNFERDYLSHFKKV